jgi:hypothetical protein
MGQYSLHIRWVIAAVGHIYVARAAFDEAVKTFPNQRLALRDGILLICEHPELSATR